MPEYYSGCFWMRLMFGSVGGVNQTALPNVGEPHPVSRSPEDKKRLNLPWVALVWNMGFFPPAFGLKPRYQLFLGVKPSDLGLEIHHCLSGVSSLPVYTSPVRSVSLDNPNTLSYQETTPQVAQLLREPFQKAVGWNCLISCCLFS